MKLRRKWEDEWQRQRDRDDTRAREETRDIVREGSGEGGIKPNIVGVQAVTSDVVARAPSVIRALTSAVGVDACAVPRISTTMVGSGAVQRPWNWLRSSSNYIILRSRQIVSVLCLWPHRVIYEISIKDCPVNKTSSIIIFHLHKRTDTDVLHHRQRFTT